MARIKSCFTRRYFYTLKETASSVQVVDKTIHALNLCAFLIQRERVLGFRFFSSFRCYYFAIFCTKTLINDPADL